MLGRTSTKTLTGIDQNRLNEQELKNIQLEVDQIETQIEQIQAEQLIQNADILQNSTDIATNAQGVATNLASITALEAEQIVQNTNINLNSIDIDDLETRADAFDTQQAAQDTAISSLDTRATALEGRADATDTHQAVQDAQISTLQTTVGNNFQSLLDELNNIQQQVHANDADIVALDIRITENRNKIDELEFYQFNILMSLFYTKDETNGLFVALRGTYTVGTIGELKTNLEALISALDTSTSASIANLQGRVTTEEQQTALQWTAISDLQAFDTGLQNQITAIQSVNNTQNDTLTNHGGRINTLEDNNQYISSNTTTTFIDSDLVVDKNIVCDKLTCTGTTPENPGLVVQDALTPSAMITIDSHTLFAQGNPIINETDACILAQNTNQSGVLVLSATGPKRCGIRITKDQTTISADTLNIRNSADSLLYQISSAGNIINSPTEIIADTFTLTNGSPDFNPMTTVTKATSTTAILAQHGNIHTNSIRFRSVIAGVAVVGTANSSYTSITPLISSMSTFTPTNPTFFVINPGFKLETYSGTNYGGSQNVFNNGTGNFAITEAAIGSVQSIKLFFRNMNGSETQIFL